MLNKTILMGRLVEDPELRRTPTNVKVCTFRIAVDRDYLTGDKRLADFFNVVAWRAGAEFVCKYFKKGKPIIIEGRFENRAYLANDNTKRYITELIADRLGFAGDNPGRSTPESPAGHDGQVQLPADGSDFTEVIADSEDLPF